MSLVNQILETCLYVSDIKKATAFYQVLFDLEPYAVEDNRHVFFRIGECILLLFNPAETEKGGSVPAHGAIGQGHIAFTIEHRSLDFWRNRLYDQKIEIEQEYNWPSGGKSIYFRDPFMNSVELATSDTWV